MNIITIKQHTAKDGNLDGKVTGVEISESRIQENKAFHSFFMICGAMGSK
jgi:hypothetical protein